MIENEEKNTIILGDINLNILNDKDSSEYLNITAAKGFVSKFNKPTRDNNCLDHILVRSQILEVNVNRLEEQISDHAILQIRVLDDEISQQYGIRGNPASEFF